MGRLLSDLEAEGSIVRVPVGREKVIGLPGTFLESASEFSAGGYSIYTYPSPRWKTWDRYSPFAGAGRRMARSAGDGASTILIVDDDPTAIRLLDEAFDHVERPVSLFVAMDGVEAFDVLSNRGEYDETPRPDLIMLDLNLPGKQGQQILAEMQADADSNTIPVTVFSNVDDPETIAECYRLGANAYIVKPMDYEEMLVVVDHLTDFWL